jgi:hypothetical protein
MIFRRAKGRSEPSAEFRTDSIPFGIFSCGFFRREATWPAIRAGSWARFDTHAQAAHRQQNQERDIPITCEIRDERPIFP